MSRNDEIDYTYESTFKVKLRKLYRLTMSEGLRHNVDLSTFEFIGCEGFNDIVDVSYTDGEKDFAISVRGSEKRGYRILSSCLDDALIED